MDEKYKDIIISRFNEDVYNDIISRWNESHRYYHNIEHLYTILGDVEDLLDKDDISYFEYLILVIAAFFHDAVYYPSLNNNEEKSVELFTKYSVGEYIHVEDDYITANGGWDFMCTKIKEIIRGSASPTRPSVRLPSIFWRMDNSVYRKGFSKLLKWEEGIFKEYQHVSYAKYKRARITFLNSCFGDDVVMNANLRLLVDYVNNRKIRIGVYAGSFNPFHIGHYDVLKKAENIFDKVIVAFGVNPDKEKSVIEIPKSLDFNEKIEYTGLITDLLDEVGNDNCEVSLVRGIRNGDDLNYESNQIAYINDIRPNTSVIMFLSDKKYEHISSSAIRNLSKYGSESVSKYLIK